MVIGAVYVPGKKVRQDGSLRRNDPVPPPVVVRTGRFGIQTLPCVASLDHSAPSIHLSQSSGLGVVELGLYGSTGGVET